MADAAEGDEAPKQPAAARVKPSSVEFEQFTDDELREMNVEVLKASLANSEGASPRSPASLLPLSLEQD